MFHKKIFFILIALSFSVVSQDLQPDRVSSVEDTGQAMPVLNTNNHFTAAPVDESQQAKPELTSAIHVGTALSAVGTIMWSVGKVLEVVGIATLVSGVRDYDMDRNYSGSFAILFTGMALDLFGPIPSCIGEGIVKGAMDQHNSHGAGKNSGMSSGKAYGLNWAFLGTGMVINFIPVLPTKFVAMGLGGTAEVFRGIAAIGPLVRISHVGSSRVSVSPYFNFNKDFGLQLSCKF